MQKIQHSHTGGQTSLNANAILRRKVVSGLTGKSRSTLYRDISKGLFPHSIEIGGGCVGWPCYEVEQINNARISGKSDDEIKQLVVELEAARKQSNADLAA
ncbi:helix-turn-helix transcriptional regulator [Methylomonas sp. MK1]|uniref:helix-turn-helix transcriptional regulator n=1 Tax=Methylomonas sp. MK1 TaxID=1131552 RepID=UPI00037FE2FD|nr:AlpA family phage regulatory protein [Methylomonas sp. MK1]